MQKLDFDLLSMPRLGLASLRGRFILRGAFVLLMVATILLALLVLQDEKLALHKNQAINQSKTLSEVTAQLRHPAGQLALLNPSLQQQKLTPLRPLLLPYAAIDFDDQYKAQQAIELSGCSTHYPDQGEVCVGLGNNPYAGGFIYVVGHFFTDSLVPRGRGELDLNHVHRARISVSLRGQVLRWIAPFETSDPTGMDVSRGRLTGFVDHGIDALAPLAKPVRDFRGWMWQTQRCSSKQDGSCTLATFFSIRLPISFFQEDLFGHNAITWPPEDLDRTLVHLQMLAPEQDEPIFDSNRQGAMTPFAWRDLSRALQPWETLTISHARDKREIIKIEVRNHIPVAIALLGEQTHIKLAPEQRSSQKRNHRGSQNCRRHLCGFY